jgi:hypothetical protein
MNVTEKLLKEETGKWLEKLEREVVKAKILKTDSAGNEMENVKAYIKDCRHFLEKGDFIRAFEAVVYAWGIFETLEHLGLVEKSV